MQKLVKAMEKNRKEQEVEVVVLMRRKKKGKPVGGTGWGAER